MHEMQERWKERIKNICDLALDLVYPPGLYCICCGKIIDESRTYHLCNECMDGIKWIQDRTCVKCGKRLSPVNPGETCFNCKEHDHKFDRGFTAAEYGTCERAIIYALKYDGRTDIADVAGEILYDRMCAEFGPEELSSMYDAVLPVPLHASKQARRGYNQAALIGMRFADLSGLAFDDDILIRTRETHIMKSLGPEERRENICGAFGIRSRRHKDITGKKLLVVDDIYTTGATSDEIAGILKEVWTDASGRPRRGADSVDILTFAAGADMVKELRS